MRIGHICSNYDNFFTNLMDSQISNGLDPRVFYFRAKERGLPDVNSTYVDVRLNYSKWHRPFFYLKESTVLNDFFNIYKKDQFDLIHAHTIFSNGYIALKAKKRWGTPYIVAVRNVDINVFFKYRLNLRKLGIEILNEADKIIFLSPAYKDLTLSRYVPELLREDFSRKSIILPNGIDQYFLNNIGLKRQLKINNTIHIISVGHVCKNKNQLTVCKVIEQLNKLGIKVDYTVVGKVLDKKLFKKILSYDFVNYIPFLSKEELITEYRNSDIFVLPSLTETFGLTYVEAMSQGLPVIYTKGEGFDGQFEEGLVGYGVSSLNIEEIKKRIIDIKNNYSNISSNCIESSKNFNWNDITAEYIGLYEQVRN